jgi:hypothetical protein
MAERSSSDELFIHYFQPMCALNPRFRARPHTLSPILLDILLTVELLSYTSRGHVPNLNKDRSLEPWTVELSDDRPRNAGVAVGIAAVEFILIVQINGNS